MKQGDREYFNRLLKELLEYEERHEIFWLTRAERREFQAYVEEMMENDYHG